MNNDGLADPGLVHFEPPERPPTGLTAARIFLRNFIETFPRSIYQQGLTRLKQGFYDTLIVCDPVHIADVLVDRPDTFRRDPLSRRAMAAVTGETSLILAEGAAWRWQRRAVAPTFRYDTALSFVPTFSAMATRLVERWHGNPPDLPIEVEAAMNEITFQVIAETMLGGSSAHDVADYRRALVHTLDAVRWHSLLALVSLPRWVPFPGKRRATRANAYLTRKMTYIIKQRRMTPSAQSDLVDLLLAAQDGETGRRMTNEELSANLLSFINAGHETTAAALIWTLWLVARDEGLQERLAGEVAGVAGDRPIAAPDIERLVLCRQTIQEAMRLYPPVPAIARQAVSNTQVGDQRVTTSTMILIPIFAVHRHLQLWDNPNCFDLNRFAPSAVKVRSRYAYLPFGAGPRTCIGASFALMETTVMVATLLRAFRLRPLPGYKPELLARATLRPKGGLPLMIERR